MISSKIMSEEFSKIICSSACTSEHIKPTADWM